MIGVEHQRHSECLDRAGGIPLLFEQFTTALKPTIGGGATFGLGNLLEREGKGVGHGIIGRIFLANVLKAEEALKHIPVIAVTAFAMKGDEEKIRAGGCEDYIAKPISVPQFIQTVKKYLD